MKKGTEKWFPYVIGFATIFIYLVFLPKYKSPTTPKELLPTIVSLSSITTGFLATALAILFTIPPNHRGVRLLITGGAYNDLIDYLTGAITWSFVLAIISVIGLLIDFKVEQIWYPFVFSLWLFVLTTAACSCYRVIYLFAKILKADHKTRN